MLQAVDWWRSHRLRNCIWWNTGNRQTWVFRPNSLVNTYMKTANWQKNVRSSQWSKCMRINRMKSSNSRCLTNSMINIKILCSLHMIFQKVQSSWGSTKKDYGCSLLKCYCWNTWWLGQNRPFPNLNTENRITKCCQISYHSISGSKMMKMMITLIEG